VPNTHETDKPRHPIQVVSRRTGISTDVLRAWERRYGAVTPWRSDSQRRLYSDQDIDRLTLLRRATEAGHSIGQLATLADTDLLRIVAEDLTATISRTTPEEKPEAPTSVDDTVRDALEAARRLDPRGLLTVLQRASLLLSPGDLVERVCVPLMRTLGDLWHRGELGIAHEHMATAVVRGLLSDLALLPDVSGTGPTLVVATPRGQQHELGALVVAATATATGWKVTYLGTDVPATDVAEAVRRTEAGAVALSITLPDRNGDLVEELRSLREQISNDTVLIVGGMAAPSYVHQLRDLGALMLGDMPSLRAILSSLRSENGGDR
jgi:methanogenic corrinoid protein MtbC1